MVRQVTSNYGVWLAGYYDDFNSARAIPDDVNAPSSTDTYSITKSHYGNPMNGEATLNPRYRFSIADRNNMGSNHVQNVDRYLSNGGIFEWLSYDESRQKAEKWEGRAQIQYPDGHVANRYEFNTVSSEDYLLFSNGYDSLGEYYVGTGDNDATFGRADMKSFHSTNYNNKIAGQINANGDFIQRAHLVGCWAAEQIDFDYSDPTPRKLFGTVVSPSGQPFLAIQTWRTAYNSSVNTPTLIYKGSLNSRLDGDTFTTRVAARSFNGVTTNDGKIDLNLRFQIGFESADFPTTNISAGYSNTAAIDKVIDLANAGTIQYNALGFETDYVNDDTWVDIDFVMDYTAQTFDVYINGYKKVSAEAFDETRTADNMYGFQLTLEPKSGSSTTTTLMVDRVGLVRCLTDAMDYASYDAPVDALTITQPVNGISQATLKIIDDAQLESGGPTNLNRGMRKQDYLLNLKDIFTANSPVDWSLLVFANQTPRIDRPVWRGIISKLAIEQNHDKRMLTFLAEDNLSLLDRQIPLWEVGQKGLNEDESVTDYWLYDAQGFRNIMQLGTLPLKLFNSNLGFDVNDSYLDASDSRMQLGSGHPIQMYNNEDEVFGPNDLEDQYEGFFVEGFYQDTSGRTVFAMPTGHSLETGNTVTLKNSFYSSTNGSYSIVNYGSNYITFSATDVPYANGKGTGNIVYAGKYRGEDTYPYGLIPNPFGNLNAARIAQLETIYWENFVANNYPNTDDAISEVVTFFFDADPALLIGDKFYVNGVQNSGSIQNSYTGSHTVSTVKKIINYFSTYSSYNYIWCVTTNTPYEDVEFGTYTSNTGLQTTTNAKSWNQDKVSIVSTTGNFDKVKTKVLHSRWMRDMPNSLWFQYHFGQIKHDEIDSCILPATVAVNDTIVQITSSLYSALTNYKSGIAELVSGTNVTKFIYQGILSSGGNYYLVGCKYIGQSYAHNNPVETLSTVKILDISDDYKHLWLLWADMRNNGNADADGSFRKKEFGLQFPVSENYQTSLYYVDQKDDDGNIDKFAELKINEDIDIWNVDATNEPVSGAAFSKTPDYSLGEEVSSFTYGANQLVIEGLTESRYTVGSYATVYNSLHYDGTYEITSISGTSNITLKGVTAGTNTNAAVGNIMVAPAAASETDLLIYHDWEDKAGSFIVIDSAKFFNLNTLANSGKSGQHVGGNTDLNDYTATVEGFPALIDNYYAEAISSYKTTATPISPHPNERRLLSDATLADEGLIVGDIGLPVQDTSNFATTGSGIIVCDLTSSDDTQEFYFSWKEKLDTAVEVSSITGATYQTGGTYEGYWAITKSGETFIDKGVKKGMLIKNTSTGGRHYIYHATQTVLYCTGKPTATWAVGNNFTIPVQLANVFLQTVDSITASIEDSATAVETELLKNYNEVLGGEPLCQVGDNLGLLGVKIGASITIVGENKDADSITVSTTVSSQFMLRLLMHIDGGIKSQNSGSFYDSDKFRLLWSAALMKTWLPKTRLSCAFDINNIPITSNMTTDGTTTNNDSYGSTVDSRTKTILSTIEDIRGKSGFGDTNGLKTTFSYLMGKDGRIEYRPKYNSGLSFTRENLKVSTLKTDVAGQITNVRVYYMKGKSFVDYPATNLTDTTRWKVLEYPNITSSIEAEFLAKQTYNQNQNTKLLISAKPILESNLNNQMIESGRHGYISDPQIALQGYGDYDASNQDNGNSWTKMGTGGVLFSGMTNGLDGNMKDSTDLYNRFGVSARSTLSTSDISWDDNYYWYGSRSLSYALQIVHVPNFTPKVKETTGEPLRVFISLKNGQSGTDIDNAEFTIHLVDYSFSNDTDKDPTLVGSSSKDVKQSGFYEIDIPSTYGAVANAKMVVSFNAEYCRALLRHRCGVINSDILSNANAIQDISMSTANTNSIFPLGGKEYSEMYAGFTTIRNEWYAPRVNIVNDLSYTPATFVTYTDAGLGITTPTSMTISKVTWMITAGKKEEINLLLERDESLSSDGVLSYLFPNKGKSRQVAGNDGDSDSTIVVFPAMGRPSPPKPQGQEISQSSQFPQGGANAGSMGSSNSLGITDTLSINNMSRVTYGAIKGRMNLLNDNLSHNSKFSILGQQRPPIVPTTLKSIEGMDVSIQTASGNASITSDGYILAGKGRVDLLNETATTTTFESTLETEFVIPLDVIDKSILIEAKITHAQGSINNTRAVLYTTASIVGTSDSISNTVFITSNTEDKNVELIPQSILSNLKAGNKIKVTVIRKAATGQDNSDRNSVLLKNLNVKLNRATAPVSGSSNKFSIQ
jgi:hypothetical protein